MPEPEGGVASLPRLVDEFEAVFGKDGSAISVEQDRHDSGGRQRRRVPFGHDRRPELLDALDPRAYHRADRPDQDVHAA